MGFGFSFWGMAIYAVLFIAGYFTWAVKKNKSEEDGQ